jgi:fermentation-respiration switch protein FrsA (DUF1100 family)
MLAAFILIVALITGVAVTGDALTRPARHSVGYGPTSLAAESLTLQTREGQTVASWLVRGDQGCGAILLVHGVRADRRDMIGRATYLRGLGYTVLLIDLPAHGESSGTHITYGLQEARGIEAALDYLTRELPQEHVGVIGVSLGGAAFLFAALKSPPNAVVLESVYPTIDEALANRLRLYFGPVGKPLAPLFTWQLPLRLGVSSDQLRPIDAIRTLRSPVLIISGGNDQHTTREETERLFGAAPEPKELWIVEGAAHVDLHTFKTSAYEARITAFLAKYLRHSRQPSNCS